MKRKSSDVWGNLLNVNCEIINLFWEPFELLLHVSDIKDMKKKFEWLPEEIDSMGAASMTTQHLMTAKLDEL
jgi:hypothetical protein